MLEHSLCLRKARILEGCGLFINIRLDSDTQYRVYSHQTSCHQYVRNTFNACLFEFMQINLLKPSGNFTRTYHQV
jgi:hypothetical protein